MLPPRSALGGALLVAVLCLGLAGLYWNDERGALLLTAGPYDAVRPGYHVVRVGDPPFDYKHGEWVSVPPVEDRPVCPFVDPRQDCLKYELERVSEMNETERADFSSYMDYAWRDSRNERTATLDPHAFLAAMRGRSLAFAGDSLGRNQYESLLCILASSEAEIQHHRGGSQPGWDVTFPEYDFSMWYVVAPLLLDHVRAEEEPREFYIGSDAGVAKWAARAVAHADAVVINLGHWLGKAKVHACPTPECSPDTVPSVEGAKDGNAVELLVPYMRRVFAALSASVSAAGDGARLRHVVFRTFSPAHFKGGAWNTGGTCSRRRRDADAGTAAQLSSRARGLLDAGRSLTGVSQSSFPAGLKFHLLDVTEISALREDGHPGNIAGHYDCSHWCVPGVPDTWNAMLALDVLMPELAGKQMG